MTSPKILPYLAMDNSKSDKKKLPSGKSNVVFPEIPLVPLRRSKNQKVHSIKKSFIWQHNGTFFYDRKNYEISPKIKKHKNDDDLSTDRKKKLRYHSFEDD